MEDGVVTPLANQVVADEDIDPLIPLTVTATVNNVARELVGVMGDTPFMETSLRYFYDKLDLPGHNYEKRILLFRLGTESAYDVIVNILQDWVQNIGTFATTGELISVLRDIREINMAGAVANIYPQNQTIITTPSLNVDGTGTPNQLPLFFQIFSNANHNSRLIGRDVETRRLLALYKNFRQNPSGSGIVLIQGVTGVGKSFLANHFCHRVREVFNHSCIWLNGNSPGAMSDSVRRVAGRLLHNSLSDALSAEELDFEKPEHLLERVHRYHENVPILLVIDEIRGNNYMAKTLLSSLRGLSFPRVFVVLTSNCDNIAGLLNSSAMDCIQLDRLEMDMQTAFRLYFQEAMSFPRPENSWAFRDHTPAEIVNPAAQALSAMEFKRRYLSVDNASRIAALGGSDPMLASLFVKYLSYQNAHALRSNPGLVNPINRFLEQANAIMDDEEPLDSRRDKLLHKILNDFLTLLDCHEGVQGCASFFLKLIYWLMPQGKADLAEVKNIFSCVDSGLGKKNTPFRSATIGLLEEYRLIRVDPQLFYNDAIPDEKLIVELHPALRRFFTQDRFISDVKLELGQSLVKNFHQLDQSTTAKTFIGLKEELLANFSEFRKPPSKYKPSPSLYSKLEELLTFATDPKAAYSTWIRWLSVAAGYNFIFTFIVTIGMAVFFLLSPPTGSDLGLVIFFAWCCIVFFVYCGVVCYIGLHILRNSSTMLLYLFAGDLHRKKRILQAATAGVVLGYCLLTGLFAVVNYGFTIYVILLNCVYIVGFLLIIFHIVLIKTVFRSKKKKGKGVGKGVETVDIVGLMV